MSYFESFKSGQKVAGLLFSFWQERKLVIRVGQSDLMKGFPSLNTFPRKKNKSKIFFPLNSGIDKILFTWVNREQKLLRKSRTVLSFKVS